MKKLNVLALIFLVSAFSFSQSINVTFQVDMSYQIANWSFPPGANVVVRGDFQTDAGDPGGNWQGNLFQLSDPDDDTVYTGTFNAPASLAGNTYIYKYVIVNPPAGDNWESTPNREFTLTSPATLLPLVYFNDDYFIYDTLVTNTINFTADISDILGVGIGEAFDPTQDSLLVMGLDWDYLGQDVTGERRMTNTDPFNQGIYTTTLSVTSTAGILEYYNWNDSTNWKFKAYPDSRFQSNGWEMGNDRWHIYEADGSTITLPTIVPLINPRFDTTTIDVDLTINVDMVGAVNRYNGLPIQLSTLEFVGMRGGADFLGNWNTGGCWCVTDTLTGNMKVLSRVSSTIWSYNIIIPTGSVAIGAYHYKFAAMYPGADTVNGGINPLDNEGYDDFTHSLLISNTSPIVKFHSFGTYGPNPSVERIENLLPTDYRLEQNYPNPFNPGTKIRYSIPELSFVNLIVFNLLGEEIETLVNGEQSVGVYEATFDASNVSSGIYFYTLKTESFSSSKKMILVR